MTKKIGTYTWEYGGPKKVMPAKPPIEQKDTWIIKEASFIINTSSPLRNKKTKGPPALFTYNELFVMDYQLESIKNICKNPQIIYVTGYDSHKIIKHKRRNEFMVVENQLFEITNSAHDFRTGINAAIYPTMFWISGNLITTHGAYKSLYRNGKQSSVLYYKDKTSTDIGLEFNRYNVVIKHSFSTQYKSKGMYFFNESDTSRLKRKISVNKMNNNWFDFELMSETKLLAIEDKTQSLLCDGD